MAGILDLIAGNPQHTGLAAQLLNPQPAPTTGIGPYLQNSQSAGAMATAQPAAPQHHPFFGRGGTGRQIVGMILDGIAGFGGQPPGYAGVALHRRELQDQSNLELQRWEAQQAWKDAHPDVPVEQQNWEAYINASPDKQAQIAQYRTMSAPRFVVDPATGAYGQVGAPQAAAPAGPQPGAVIGGYRFRGGNPNDQRSWEPVGGSAVTPQTGFRGPN